MSASRSHFIRLPGESERELWICDEDSAWRRSDADDGRKGGWYAVEAVAIDSAPFWAPATVDAGADLSMIAALHWEALGASPEPGAQNWVHWRVGSNNDRIVIGTMALTAETKPDEWLSLLPETFEPSARLRRIPPGECAVWRELGRLVVAFARGEHLLHVAVLNTRMLDAEAAREVHDLAHALEAAGLLHVLNGCRLWTPAEDDFAASLCHWRDLNVRAEPLPPPTLPKVPSGLLPAAVMRRREFYRARRRTQRLVALFALTIVLLYGTWGGWLALRAHQVEKAAAALIAKQPDLEAVREAQLRWNALEAATDPDACPVEVFHQVISMLPAQGIQLQEFSFTQEKVVMGGVSSSVNYALKFKSDIENNSALKRYAWTFPQPTISPDDQRATFRAEGTLNGGTSDEGE
jgi:hypothetical protein